METSSILSCDTTEEQSEFECLKYLCPNITVEQTDSGDILIRRQSHGMLIRESDLRNYINEKLHTNEGNDVLLSFQALYKYSDKESSSRLELFVTVFV